MGSLFWIIFQRSVNAHYAGNAQAQGITDTRYKRRLIERSPKSRSP
jgi:hypothetical protein